MIVKCIGIGTATYPNGEYFEVGYGNWGDFGVLDIYSDIDEYGDIKRKFSWDNFELVEMETATHVNIRKLDKPAPLGRATWLFPL